MRPSYVCAQLLGPWTESLHPWTRNPQSPESHLHKGFLGPCRGTPQSSSFLRTLPVDCILRADVRGSESANKLLWVSRAAFCPVSGLQRTWVGRFSKFFDSGCSIRKQPGAFGVQGVKQIHEYFPTGPGAECLRILVPRPMVQV